MARQTTSHAFGFMGGGQSYLRGLICLSAFAFLSACGGGGGGGSTPPTPPTPPTGQGLSLPALLSSSVEENFTSSSFGTAQYDVTVTDTTLNPTNFRLTGDDAANFQVLTTISTTANPNVFRTNLDFGNTQQFDFEMPADANSDNVYSFDYVFDYGETTYSTPIEIAIENVAEDVIVAGSVIRLEFEPTGAKVMPDVTGDSLPDVILLENEEMFFTSGVYIMGSETVASSVGLYNPVLDSELHGNFNPSNDGFENLTSRPSADGTGFDLIYSNSFLDRYTYYDVNSAADSAFLSGEVDPAATSNNGSNYVHNDPNNSAITSQIIHDVNLDGQNDIFTFDLLSGEMGIRYGASGNSQPDRTSVPDILIANDDLAGVQPVREITIETAPDLDGDGTRELMILSPFYMGGGGNDGAGAVWIVYSSFLATNPASLDLVAEAANTQNVRQITGAADQRFGMSYTELTDGNGDPYLLFGTGEASENQGLIGARLSNLTTLAQTATSTDLANVGVIYSMGADSGAGTIVTEPIGAIRPIADIDGDGQTDYLSLNSFLIKSADLVAGADSITGEHVILQTDAPRLKRTDGSFGSSNIIYLEDQGFIAYSQSNTDGEYMLLAVDDLIAAVAMEEGDIAVETPL